MPQRRLELHDPELGAVVDNVEQEMNPLISGAPVVVQHHDRVRAAELSGSQGAFHAAASVDEDDVEARIDGQRKRREVQFGIPIAGLRTDEINAIRMKAIPLWQRLPQRGKVVWHVINRE